MLWDKKAKFETKGFWFPGGTKKGNQKGKGNHKRDLNSPHGWKHAIVPSDSGHISLKDNLWMLFDVFNAVTTVNAG